MIDRKADAMLRIAGMRISRLRCAPLEMTRFSAAVAVIVHLCHFDRAKRVEKSVLLEKVLSLQHLFRNGSFDSAQDDRGRTTVHHKFETAR